LSLTQDLAPLEVRRASSPRRRHPASIIAWPHNLIPAVEIAGEPVSADAIRVYPDAKAATSAARHWCRRVAWEISAQVLASSKTASGLSPEDQSQAAELFAMRHKLSILLAFHRRLRRADVVAEILKLFANISHVSAT
jgi:hypothetical protein